MRFLTPVALIALPALLAAGPARSQETLPGAFAGWLPAGSARFTPAQVEQVSPGNRALLMEYGLQRAERRTYRKGGNEISVLVLEFRDPTGAYGAFTALRPAELAPSDWTEKGALGSTRAMGAFANLLVDVTGNDLLSRKADLAELLKSMQPKADHGPFPTLGDFFPLAGEVASSRRFLLGPQALERFLPTGKGDWVGFDAGAEAELAQFRVAGRAVKVLLVAYPTPQVAGVREKGLSRWFNVNAAEETVSGRPVLFVQRRASLLAVVSGADSAAEAGKLLEKVSYQAQITWNEPGYKATDPHWSTMIYGVFLGTFYFVGFGLAVGVVFAGLRLGIKKLFPGKVFDRPESVEILQLGLGSKPIEGKDFYQ